MKEQLDSFTIGTAATGGCIKIYLEGDLKSEETGQKIYDAINLWANAKDRSDRLKQR